MEDELEYTVKYLVACTRATVPSDGSHARYSLLDVRYKFVLPGDREWPVRLDQLSLFARFYSAIGTRSLTLRLDWLDAPSGEVDVGYFDWQASFPQDEQVHDKIWNVSAVWYPGPGRYRYRLIDDGTSVILAEEYIEVRRDHDA